MKGKVIVQVLFYLGKKMKRPIDKLTALKLIFFADRYHIRKYSCLITDDSYYAFQYGPVGINTYDILNLVIDNKEMSPLPVNRKYINEYLAPSKVKYCYICSNNAKELNLLTEENIEALDFVIDQFGHMSSSELVSESHKYPEWKKHYKASSNGLQRERILETDFYDDADIEEDPFNLVSKNEMGVGMKSFLSGMGRALDLGATMSKKKLELKQLRKRQKSPEEYSDLDAIKSDFINIGNDLEEAIKKLG